MKTNEPYREFLVNYETFKNDMNSKKINLKKEKLEEVIDNSKILFKKQGIQINWSALSELSIEKQIYNLSMIHHLNLL